MAEEHVKIEGLHELVAAFGKIDKGLRKELQRELKGVAEIVAEKARSIARSEGLYDKGALIKGIKAGMSGSTALVRETAMRNGFRYPAVYEYGRISPWQATKGIRPFLEPALEKEQKTILLAMEGILDRLASEAGFGRGGTL